MCCRGCLAPLDGIEFDDPAVSASEAGVKLRFDIPIFSGFGQFSLYILALEKQGFCTLSHQRLGKTDTGEETRKKQTEIVKNLEQLIEQMRNSSAQSKSRRNQLVMQPGQQGQQPDQNQGANAGGASWCERHPSLSRSSRAR